jgi:hypothetical protein
MIDEIELKKELLNHCIDIQKTRIENARKAMEDAQNASISEERSTAGDKYDTSRAMSHNLRDMNAKQLNEALKELAALDQLKVELKYQEVKPGAIVKTETGNFFIATSIGQIKHHQETYFTISLLSPIGQAMAGKKQGDSFEFRGNKTRILSIF